MDLTGILPAIVTPLSSDRVFLPVPFERLIRGLYAAGVHGLYVCGQTGEGLQQSVAQRKTVLEAAVAYSPPGKLVVVHVGANTTADAIALAKHAGEAGAHAISSLPPLALYDFAEIFEFYETLAAESPVPLLLYHHPDTCPLITPDRALRLSEIRGVIGFKFTDFNLYLLSLLKARGMTMFNGRDEALAAGLFMGAVGGIGTFYNLFPGIFVKLFELARAQQWTEARELQSRLNPLLYKIFQFPLVPAVREALAMVGHDCGECISPRRKLTADEKRQVRSIVDELSDEMAGFLISPTPQMETIR
jgi:N-acetylneuraminate lyase